MAGDVEQQGQEPIESETDADFAAGLTGSEPTETPAPTPEPSPAPSPEPTEAPKYVQISEDEWNDTKSRAARVDELSASLDKRLEQVYGKVGRSIEQAVSKLRAETPAGETVQVSEEDFAELKEQYPELAEVQIKGLNKALSRFKGTADSEAIEKMLAPRLVQERDGFLEIAFPGWKDDVKTKDFADWRKTLSPEAEALAASDSHADAAKLLRMFYARTKTAPEPVPPPKPTPVPTRTRQIAAAVPPKGDGGMAHGSSNDEDDAFMAGLKGG